MSSSRVLASLPEVQRAHRNATDVTRPAGSNVDAFTHPDTGEKLALCHISNIQPFVFGSIDYPVTIAWEDAAVIAMAVDHLNTGNGVLVPEVQGLPERCPVRFSLEVNSNDFSMGKSLKLIVDQTERPIGGDDVVRPSVFFTEYRSAASVTTSVVTGVLGYPQVSASAGSSQLDDKEQFPLFGRTVPSDSGQSVPIILYFRDVLQLQHVAVVHLNDAFGNGYVESMRQVAQELTPDLNLLQIPWDADDGLVEPIVAAVKESGYRFVFVLALRQLEQDTLLEEAYRQNVVANGLHNWLFGGTFADISTVPFEKGSALAQAYQSVSYMRIISDVREGMPKYETYLETQRRLTDPAPRAILDTIFPSIYNPADGAIVEYDFLQPPGFLSVPGVWAGFTYDAAIAIGLSACAGITEDLVLTGASHYEAFKATSFSGVSGRVSFDNVTGTREPSGASYYAVNYQTVMETEEGVFHQPVTTHLFKNSTWVQQEDIIFSDGTSNLPPDIAPDGASPSDSLTFLILIPLSIVLAFGFLFFSIRESKRKSNDSVWLVKKSELKFTEPPEVLGRGTFGLVLSAEYRGTQVAVKRVVPPKSEVGKSFKVSKLATMFDNELQRSSKSDLYAGMESQAGMESGMQASTTAGGSGAGSSNSGTWTTGWGQGNYQGMTRTHQRRLKEEFVEEMRYLSRLRHPCITTVMGALIDKNEDPMLVMELMEHGSLYDLLHNETMALDGEILLPILRDISQGMRFLHAADPHVLHGDLKAQNILVDKRFRAKVADFGLSQKKNLGGSGTPFWMAPELLRKESVNTKATDVFSFGVILYEVFSRKDPYEGENSKEVLEAVADPTIRKRVQAPHDMPETLRSLMVDCMEEEPNRRPNFEEMDMRMKRLDEDNVVIRKQSQVSLFDIFPRHVAEALRDGRKVQAEHKDEVTIFFSDIVGFTKISSTLEPAKVATMLDRLYHKFDDLSHVYDIYKVETIGDAFMAVANLVKDQPEDHCKRIAEFSIAALRAANETLIDEDDPAKGYVNIRVGFHAGSVVADVVGNRNPRYCLFGDTVNTASRMESNSEKNRINCSKSAADILRQQWPDVKLASRGHLNIKGKGRIRCYWVNEEGGNYQLGDDESEQLFPVAAAVQAIRDLEQKVVLPESAVSKDVIVLADGGSSQLDMEDLEGNLRERLGRNGAGK